MVYDPSTDFIGLWRNIVGGAEKAEMPGLDWWVAAMGRAGLIKVVFSTTAPTTNQQTTAWFKTAVPSYSAEGVLYLWDKDLGTYVPATPDLFFEYLTFITNVSILSIWPVVGVPPDSLGKDGDFALRLDDPGGIYGPKTSGHWPTEPLPATSYTQVNKFLDQLGASPGDTLFRGTTTWDTLSGGPAGFIYHSSGPAGAPYWAPLSPTDLDAMLGGGVWGDVIIRTASKWDRLPASTNGYVLTTHAANANPTWSSMTSVFD